MYCRYCREKNQDNDKICKSCGKDLSIKKSKEHKYCKYCYTNNQVDAIYCYKCSADLPDETINDNSLISIVLGVVLSCIIYFILYKLLELQIGYIDILIFSLLTYFLCDWLDGIINKKIEYKNNKHFNIVGLIKDVIFTFTLRTGDEIVSYDYDTDIRSEDIKLENKLFKSHIFYNFRFIVRLIFVLFLFLLAHYPDKENTIAISLLFSFIATIII